MNSIECKLDLKKIKSDLLVGIYECTQRGLNQSAKWLSELNLSISHIKLSSEELPTRCIDFGDESEEYFMAKSCFDVKEYDRSAYFSKNCNKMVTKFLHYYAQYMSIEKKKLDNMTDSIRDPTQNVGLSDLSGVLKSEFYENKLDGYCLYLYGVVLRKLELIPLAIEAFIQSVNAAPLMWGSWQELGQLIPNKKNLDLAQLPEHWMKYFFLAHTYLEQLDNDEAMELYINLREQGFEKSSYLVAQTAIIYYNRRELDKSIELFKELEKIDPYRLDNLDTYSNLLYVREMNIQLAVLAHRAVSIDKYRVETCCVVGNYYSLRSDHTKAVTYFRRALKIKPNYLSAWTLIGHEFMELKNVNAAIQSYRRAIEINSRDYRAWYGLGQTYEMLKMPLYCLYYYKQATQFRPNDSRMIMALGETYEKLDKSENALKCYYRACNVGDVEGMALVKLAKLYDKLNEYDNAAAAYTDYCLLAENQKDRPQDEQSEFYSAFQYLANFHLKKGNLDIAQVYAFKCLESEETKEQGKAYLKTIAATRGHQEIEPVAMDETCLSEIENESNGSNMDIVFSPSVPLP